MACGVCSCSGSVVGLVLITPASGYVDQTAAFFMAVIGVPIVYFGIQIKNRLGYDDALDAFGCHAVGGFVGSILTGFFANPFVNGKSGVFYGNGRQLGLQIYASVVVGGWSFTVSFLILFLLNLIQGIRVSGNPAVGLPSLF